MTSLGRVTGLVAADLLLVQVILMARVPLIERSWGRDQLTRGHRLVGLWSFNLMLAHIVLITIGYAAAAQADLISEAWDLVVNYPGMLLAAAATVALIGVVVTSMRAVRPRFRYESWHLLHLYAYLGIGLAIPHELWTGTDFVSSAGARAYWWTAYAVAAGSIVLFRLGLPVYRSLRHQLRVHTVVREAPGVYSVWLSGRRLDRLFVHSGQFCLWRFLSGPGWSRESRSTTSFSCDVTASTFASVAPKASLASATTWTRRASSSTRASSPSSPADGRARRRERWRPRAPRRARRGP